MIWARKVLKENKIELSESSPSFSKLLAKVRQAIQQALLVYVNAAADTPGRDETQVFIDLDIHAAIKHAFEFLSG